MDWAWKNRESLSHPLCWEKRDGVWFYRTLFDLVPLSDARGWPVDVSLAEARAYARWYGARLPTEAECDRAAYCEPSGEEHVFPWGNETPTVRHGNFDFARWSPDPVGSHDDGQSAWGVHELVGTGSGQRPRSAHSPDSRRTSPALLIRRSFRNGYQARYPYVFAKFRCVRNA